jgi:hypothetical protein
VVELYFTDAPAKQRGYWLVLAPDGADVCLAPPGGEIDLRLSCTVRGLTEIWMGHTSWAAAARAGEIELTGPGPLRRAFPGWLKLNPFAQVR